MSPEEIRHFLITFDPRTRRTGVQQFGEDYVAAQAAYAKAEQANIGSVLDVVLISADSLETIKRTHSSYFDNTGRLEKILTM